MTSIRIVCMSDLHCRRVSVPDGDVLILAGDLCSWGDIDELGRSSWLAMLPHKTKLMVAGNHDWPFARECAPEARALVRSWGFQYLQDESADAHGLRFYGSPWQPEFNGWAFNLPRGAALSEKWAAIPEETDVLITHGPPHGIRDWTVRGESVGCQDLARRVHAMRGLRLHVFGHIHGAHGLTRFNGCEFVNASICTEQYQPFNMPIVVDLEVAAPGEEVQAC